MSCLSKVANFNLPHPHLASPLGVTPLEFSEVCAIVWCCMRDPTFSRFSRTLTSDRQTDTRRQLITMLDSVAWVK